MRPFLRAAFGLAAALVIPRIDVPDALVRVLAAASFLVYLATRLLVLVEPGCRAYLAAHRFGLREAIGEAMFASLWLLFAVLSWSDIVPLSLGLGVGLTCGFLVVHTLALIFGEAAALARPPAAPRPRMRRWLRAGGLAIEESVLFAVMAACAGARADLLAGPWTLSDALTLPLFSAALLLFAYVPIRRAASAAQDTPERIRDVVAIHFGALWLFALTGYEPAR